MHTTSRPLFAVIGLLAALTILYTVVIAKPLDYHMNGATIADDAFYYLKYVQNLARGNGPTFDGLTRTNGVQPLWTLLLIIPAALFKDHLTLMRVALGLAALCAVSSVAILGLVLRRLCSDAVTAVALFIYGVYLTTTFLALTGMELPLHLCTFSLMVYSLVILIQSPRPTHRQIAFLAGTLTLICLTRVDNVLFIPWIVLIVIWYWRKSLRWRALVVMVLQVAVPALLVMSAYFLLNRAAFGVFLPISGEVKAISQTISVQATFGSRFATGYLLATARDAIGQLNPFVTWIFGPMLLSLDLCSVTRLIVVALVAGIALLAITPLTRHEIRDIQFPFWSAAVLLLTVGCAVHVYAFYWQLGLSMVRWQTWYYAPEIIVIIVWIAVGLRFLDVGRVRRVVLFLIGAYAAVAIVFGMARVQTYGREPDQQYLTLYDAAVQLDRFVPAGVIAGSFNCGAIGYFSDHTVINLDGLMNDTERLINIQQQLPLIPYLHRHHIQYLLDYMPPVDTVPTNVGELGPDDFELVATWPDFRAFGVPGRLILIRIK